MVSVCCDASAALFAHSTGTLLKIHQCLLQWIHGHVLARRVWSWKPLSALGCCLIVGRSNIKDIVAHIELECCAWISPLFTFRWSRIAIEHVVATEGFGRAGIGRADHSCGSMSRSRCRLRCPGHSVRTIGRGRMSYMIVLLPRLSAEWGVGEESRPLLLDGLCW